MKKFALLFILTLSFSLTSCSDDDNNSSNTSGELVGTWMGTAIDYSGTTETTVQGITIDADFVGEAYDIDYSLTFSENPNNVEADGSYSIELETTVNGQTTTQDVEDLEFLNDGTWSRDGNDLTITDDGQSSTARIVELTDTTLRISISQVDDLSDDGFTIISTTDVVATYTRQ